MFLETITGNFFYHNRQDILSMKRSDLQEYLEMRGYAVYEDEPTELLRETALEDFASEAP